MRQDLLQAITKEKEITNAIVLTHNIDFVFLQTLVLSALRRCGQPTLTVFADAGCAIEAFARQSSLLDGLGTRYRVVPVAMEPGFCFHPKAILLSGSASATLYVGSGNLTFGGWRENAEIWLRFHTQTDGTGAFAAFRQYLRDVLSRIPLANGVQAEVAEAFDPNTREWASRMDPPSGLIGKVGEGRALIENMRAYLAASPSGRLTVCAPYYDDNGEALAELTRSVGSAEVEVVVQRGRSGLTRNAWARQPPSCRLVPVAFHRQQSGREPFLHAKVYGIENGDRVVLFAGSANCSRAALLIPGSQGNAELLAIREVSKEDFQTIFTSELTQLSETPQLVEVAAHTDTEADETQLRILAARYESGQLQIAYAPRNITITGCRLDGRPIGFACVNPGLLQLCAEFVPRTVVLEGSMEGIALPSARGWVDHEQQLRATARARHLADAIRAGVRPDVWSPGAWNDLLGFFCKHLSYLPSRLSFGSVQTPQPERTRPLRPEFTQQDVFSTNYGLPPVRLGPLPGPESRVRSFQQLLLRWFGLPLPDYGESAGTSPDDTSDEDTVDQPEELHTPKSRPNPKGITERDRRRTKKAVTEITHILTSSDFLDRRPPELLGRDLGLASALLRVGLSEDWLEQQTFFEATHRIWSVLFLTSTAEPSVGWFEQRYRQSEAPAEFAGKLRSPELAAALTAWTFAVPKITASPDYSRFAISSCLAVARLPWLWDNLELDAVARELATVVVSATTGSEAPDRTLQALGEHWRRMIRRGHALRRMEQALAAHQPAELSARIHQEVLEPAELLWQGTSGFCVVLERCDRNVVNSVNVLRLQGKAEKSKYKASLTVPVRALLDEQVLVTDQIFGKEPRAALSAWLDEIGLRCAYQGGKRR